ncbi:unnamed protein product [Cochlearia groenlandica]
MLLFIPKAKLLRLNPRRTFHSLAKGFTFKEKQHSDTKSQVSLDKECVDFLPWLEKMAGEEITNSISIGKSIYGRSLFASKPIHAGECILKVPFIAQITPHELPLDIRLSLKDEVGNIGKLAVVLMIEKKKGQKSRWYPYISRLPQLSEIHNTVFWCEDELDMIRCSAVHKETVKQKAQIEIEFSLVAKAFNQHCPKVIESSALEDFMHAYALVGTRAWETSKGISLIPFVDFVNHDGLSSSIVLSDEDNQLSEVNADRNYSPGDEVFIRYGEFSNATLVLDFGFTLPHNIHDEVQIEMNVPNNDPLRNTKLRLLKTHHTRSVKDINIFQSSYDTFTIKEVRSTKGKGRGIPQSLRAFARVLCCTSLQELDDLSKEAEQNDGRLARLPFKDKKREFESHKILLSHINILIENHSGCIKDIEESTCRFVSQRFAVRRKMARDLLFGELRVLRSAVEWLNHYCTNLFSVPI